MRITGVSLFDFRQVVEQVSGELYDGNLAVADDAHVTSSRSCVARVTVKDSHGTGARTSWTGRHGPYACWHAYRDALMALFARYPDAKVRTMMADYTMDTFLNRYPATAWVNVGSEARPVRMPELCGCGPYETARHLTRRARVVLAS